MKPGDHVRVHTKDDSYEGTLMPEEENVLVLKLASGYNIGLLKKHVKGSEVIKKHNTKKRITKKVAQKKDLPLITILHTGGTIASKVDYATGGVIARFTPEELLSLFPEIRDIANVKSRLISNMWSEDMRFAHYNILAKEIEKEVKAGAQGVIITHGTDTLHYTSAALSFMLENCPIPVIVVGAQRSSDRPSSDAAYNVIGACIFITQTNFTGVAVAMHASIDDELIAILPGTKTRKMHTSRRDAFKAINAHPLSLVNVPTKTVELYEPQRQTVGKIRLKLFKPKIKVGILRMHTNMYADQFSAYENFDGLVLEGTGLGHAPIEAIDEHTNEHKKILRTLNKLIKNGVHCAMASQAIDGRINLNVYSTGRKLKKIGIIGDLTTMTPETAFIKLAWLLSNYKEDEIAAKYAENLRGENLSREEYDTY